VIKVAIQKNAYVDVNPVIVTSDCKIVLAKRVEGIVGGGKWHLPGGRVQFKETFDHRKTVEDAFSLLRNKCSATKAAP
jgi:ADP-ribose pyrophosphatase YjhB (NUDIX family)